MARGLHVLGVQQGEHVGAHQGIVGPAEHLRPRRVDRHDPAIQAHRDHQIGRQRPDAVELARALLHALLQRGIELGQRQAGLVALGHVLHHAAHQQGLAVGAAHDLGATPDPAQRTVVGAADRVFDVQRRRAAHARFARGHRVAVGAVGAQALHVGGRVHLLLGQAEHAAEARRRGERVALDVEHEHADAAGRLGQSPLLVELAQVFLAGRQLARGLHARGGLAHDAQHAAHAAVGLAHGRVGDVEEHLLHVAVAVDLEGPVLGRDRLAQREHALEQRVQVVPEFRPVFLRRPPHRPRVLDADRRRVGVVVEGDELRAPEQHDLGLRGQHQVDGGAQRRRPLRGRAQRGFGIGQRPDAGGRLPRRVGPAVGGGGGGHGRWGSAGWGCVARRSRRIMGSGSALGVSAEPAIAQRVAAIETIAACARWAGAAATWS